MYLHKIISGFAVAGLLLAAPSCEKIKDFEDININPGQTTEPVTAALLSNTIATMGSGLIAAGTTSTPVGGGLVWDQGGISTVAGLYAQYFSETQYTDASRYSRPTFNWDAYYAGPLYDLQTIINYNSDPATAEKAGASGSNNNQIAIARILKAHYFKFLTDAFGDLPYFEALKGKSILAYDPQEAIYPDLLKELKEAVAQFEDGATIGIKGDLMFNGDINAWKRYANSLRALIALNMSEANASVAATEFQAAISDPAGVIETNEQNAVVRFPGGNYRNPFYNYYNVTQRFDYAVSETIVNRMGTTGDARLSAFAANPKGFPYGLTREDAVVWANANADYSYVMNDGFRVENTPLVVIGAANVWLARAEAAQRGWTADNAATAYETGIRRSWEQWNVFNATAFEAYITSANVALSGGSELAKIATQEWLAWFPNGMEGWNIWRRTGNPALAPAPGTTEIPSRIPYGPNEVNLNPENAAVANSRYTAGGTENSQFARVWWDKQ
jgi:hypothetical protein